MILLFLFGVTFAIIDCERQFSLFQTQFGKQYDSKGINLRKRIYCENLDKINAINRQNLTWKAGVNKYSDLNWNEFQQAVGLLKAPQECSATKYGSVVFTDDEWSQAKAKDWRNETCGETSCVSGVKDQGSCGSCWTFSTVGALEAAHAIKTKEMILFSEQQLVDCAQNFKNMGCDGGLPSQAFEYIKYNGGLDRMDAYPYVCGDGKCKPDSGSCKYKENGVGVKVTAVHNFTEGDERSMKRVIATQQPVSVAFEVVDDLMHYESGVYTSKHCHDTPDKVNHAVLAVGYGTDDGMDFWIIKNSWGEGWGNRGYFNIERGANMCGIAVCSSYPDVEGI